ncbi:MAG: Ig-like domain-containing protein, partial [Mesorhizobium sp.]|nr:Ig-like domain-containing protein [Mesorhizobium sp.]
MGFGFLKSARNAGRWSKAAGLVTICVLAFGLFKVSPGLIRFAHNAYYGPPSITAVFPANGTTEVPAGTKIQVSFDRQLGGTAEAVDFHLSDSEGNPVNGSVRFDDLLTTATFTPNQPLGPGQIKVGVTIGQGQPKAWHFNVPQKLPLVTGHGGPILLVTTGQNTFETFYSEILRAEGLTNFLSLDVAKLDSELLAAHTVAIISGPVIEADKLAMLRSWVIGGGKLIAMRPSGELAELAGLSAPSGAIEDGYLKMDTATAPAKGLVAETIQFHGTADIVAQSEGVRTVAALFRDAASPADAPAVTVRALGDAGGQVAAFTFDLARSTVLTRQGNPEWAGQDRDGLEPVRPNDLFYGAAARDPQPDYVDLARITIPQADENMRLLSNLIGYMTYDATPLPKFWYFPNGAKAVLVMAADDHGTGSGTRDSFDRMLALSPEGCDPVKWECPRATSWMYETSGMKDRQAATYATQGFDIGSHVSTYCHNWSEQSLNLAFSRDLEKFRQTFPSLSPQQGSRLHCIVWSDYASQPKIGRSWGIRYDMNYYYWPKDWIKGQAGFMTGSGLPMRFSDTDGELINVYQQETHLVDEVFASAPEAVG